MPRPRTPANVLKLTRNYRPSRHGPVAKPEEQPLPADPPASLEAEHHQSWRDIHTAAGERLTWCDLILTEIASRLLTKVRGPEARGQDSANLLRCLAMMQIDPAHRRALIQKPDPADDFSEF